MSYIPVILSGGSGTRLWPSSRQKYPKQLLKLVGEQTMLQGTISRLDSSERLEPMVVCNNDHRFLVAEQLRESGYQNYSIILEPAQRDTAPAIALAALRALEIGDDPNLLILPADHEIKDHSKFNQIVEDAQAMSEKGALVSFGIVANKPHTGYGYIRSGELVNDQSNAYDLAEFVEKPSLEKAQEYLENGNYMWNSGMFMFKASVFLNELQQTEPEMLEACKQAMSNFQEDMDFIRVGEEEFKKSPSKSIDYAVMEKTTNAVVIPADIGWSDVGSWSALWEVKDKDDSGNVCQGDVCLNDVDNSIVVSDGKLIAAVGVSNLVIVESDDAILVADKDQSESVKTIVDKLKTNKRAEVEFHRKVFRPWGYYDSIENGNGFQVKRLVVYPGEKLSLQKHHHRAEHWVVVKGTAEVVNGDETMLLQINQSTYIPIGAKHQLSNPGKVQLELIEVQSGEYLGEDDIVRFEDIYGRS